MKRDWSSYDYKNPLLAERPFALNLSARLPPSLRNETFKWESGEQLDTQNDLAGFFRGMPLDIVHEILEVLDLKSLSRLASTSKGMKRVVSSLPKLCTLLNCAPDAKRAISALGANRMVNCADIYDKLLQPNCDHCNQPGEHLHILSCSRLCSSCLQTETRYRALRPKQVFAQFALGARNVRNLPAVRAPCYSLARRQLCYPGSKRQINTTGWTLIDVQDVHRLAIQTHGSVNKAKQLSSEQLAKLRGGHVSENDAWRQARMADRRNGLTGARGHRLKIRIGSHIPPDIESAYSVATLFPWYDRETTYFGRPVLCTACVAAGLPQQRCYYCSPGEDEHMARLGEIVEGVHVKNV